MKKFLMALAATTMIVTPIAAQAAPQHGPGPQHQAAHKPQVHKPQVHKPVAKQNDRRWGKGQRFDSRYARNYRVIGNPNAYHLKPAPRGYRWVQSGNDAVLVAIAGGLIGAVIAGAIR